VRYRTKVLPILRESIAGARSQPVATLVTALMVAGMCMGVLLTTGRSVGAEQAVMQSIDDAGTRSIVVRADPDAGLDSSVIERLHGLQGVAWSGAFGVSADVRNASIGSGQAVPVRTVWSNDLEVLGVLREVGPAPEAWASGRALEVLGTTAAAGGLIDSAGASYPIRGEMHVPAYLSQLEPLVIVPGDTEGTVTTLVVVADHPEDVGAIADAVSGILGVTDPTKVSMATSERLVTLRSIIEGQLSGFGRGLVLVVLSLTALLVAVVLYGLVLLRRKDFGRRRALGATKALIVGLLLMQTAIIAALASIAGCLVALIVLAAGRDPLPDLAFVVALIVLAVSLSTVASLVPALAAARRDPLYELRVP
jgi:putative ABC transport system permease protein